MPTTTIQTTAREILELVGIDIADDVAVVLSDCDEVGAADGGTHRVNLGQIVTAVEQFQQVTGETVDVDALMDALPWA
ncbi:hypothetical protein ABH922_001809 [Rhodococcus sp. 27YEA15]|uniref:hypothetical protein n=1 Tax=Rhodococcus sp. 27YEA15 TaxID=3156259 RepID=UPI003C7AE995